jgi:hypothetical protein
MRVLADDIVGLFDIGMLVTDMIGPDPVVAINWLSVDIDVVDSSARLDVTEVELVLGSQDSIPITR